MARDASRSRQTCLATQALAQKGAVDGEWRSIGGDPGNTKYSPLDQINRHNFQELKVAFRWESISTKVTNVLDAVSKHGRARLLPSRETQSRLDTRLSGSFALPNNVELGS